MLTSNQIQALLAIVQIRLNEVNSEYMSGRIAHYEGDPEFEDYELLPEPPYPPEIEFWSEVYRNLVALDKEVVGF